MASKYQVSAVPFDTHDQFFRAGLRFSTSPVTVTVTDSPSAPYEVTKEQFETIRNDSRLRVQEGDGPPPPTSPVEQTHGVSEENEGRRRRG
jgi:hypothetical protein